MVEVRCSIVLRQPDRERQSNCRQTCRAGGRSDEKFEIKRDRTLSLGGREIDLWGLRCGNAFYSDAVTERFIRNFDNINAHGINFVGATPHSGRQRRPPRRQRRPATVSTRHGKICCPKSRDVWNGWFAKPTSGAWS